MVPSIRFDLTEGRAEHYLLGHLGHLTGSERFMKEEVAQGKNCEDVKRDERIRLLGTQGQEVIWHVSLDRLQHLFFVQKTGQG